MPMLGMPTLGELRTKALADWQALEQNDQTQVLIGAATCGQAAGALDTIKAFEDLQAKHGLELMLTKVGCIGVCYLEPDVAGNGGRERGIPRLPSIEPISAVSSPQTNAPAPSRMWMSKL